jgi:hypothetical protein
LATTVAIPLADWTTAQMKPMAVGEAAVARKETVDGDA